MIDFNLDRFFFSLQYMWKGMLCIFIVIGVLILSIWGLNKATNAIAAKRAAKEAAKAAAESGEDE